MKKLQQKIIKERMNISKMSDIKIINVLKNLKGLKNSIKKLKNFEIC